MNKSKHGLILEVRAHIGGDTVSRWKRCQLSVCICLDRIHEVFSGLRTSDQDDRWTAQMDREVGKDRSGAHELLRYRYQLRRLDEGVCIGIEVESNCILNPSFLRQWEDNELAFVDLDKPLEANLSFFDPKVSEL
jgi:hypothetical protein